MTISCEVVPVSVVVVLVRALVSSSSRSNHVQMLSIFFFRTFRRVSFGLIPRKNPILASVNDWNFCSLMNAKLSRNVSKMPVVPSYLEPYFN